MLGSEQFNHSLSRLLGVLRGCVYGQVWGDWGFVGIGNPGKVFYFSDDRLLIESLRVPFHANLQGGIYIDFEKGSSPLLGFYPVPNKLPVLLVRTDEGGKADESSGGEKFSQASNSANIFLSIICIKS